ncbi:PREDICTED: uncharacterized protein LOC109588924 [Amphimedon queenslandica]|uniref:CARD domain-containing protein n=1 Tax=Amphimedon queenslandica TaxID=400682 RepID=A0AAN0JUL1_AMPQE|nr:PREDICTED: uncharacterized protein LOC109588924 [Amphimedon queenslandica]|eukprot:XP_019860583.1 PREDICTED: uncharacterized protein LOC109588924 [Amphimedon queenslandica]
MLVISGGEDDNYDILDDCWIFNITQHSWIKLDVPHSVSKRWAHSLSVFIMSPHCVWIITDGGYDKRQTLVTNPNIVMITELVTNSKGEWTVGDTLDTNGMNNEEYKKKYQEQLQTGRRIELEEYQKPRKRDTADIERTVQALMKCLEEKERELRQSQEAVRRYQQQALTDDHWVINKDEVTSNSSRHERKSITGTPVIPEVAYRVISECISGIRRCGIDLHLLAEKLLEKKIINNRQKRKATDEHSGRTTDQRMDQLLDIIKDSVQQEGKVFEYILEILKDEDTILANKLYDDMISKYEQYK